MSMFPIASITSNGFNQEFTFSNIPNSYKHLRLIIYGRGTLTSSQQVYIRLNGDTTANYSGYTHYGTGSSINRISTGSSIGLSSGTYINDLYTANYYAGSIIDILNYNSTTQHKIINFFTGWQTNGSGFVQMNNGLWRPATTAAVTSIGVYINVNRLNTNTQLDLYGYIDSNVTGA